MCSFFMYHDLFFGVGANERFKMALSLPRHRPGTLGRLKRQGRFAKFFYVLFEIANLGAS